MIELKFPSSQLHRVDITYEGMIIGGLLYDTVVSKEVLRRVMFDSDLKYLNELNENPDAVFINFMYVSETISLEGCSSESLALMEEFFTETGYDKIVVVVPEYFKSELNKMNYLTGRYLRGTDQFVMIKFLEGRL